MLRSSSSLVLLLLLLPVLAAGLDVSTFNQTACTNAGHHWYTHNAAVCVSEHFWNNLFNLDVVQWGDNLGTTGGSSGMAGWVMIPFTLSEDKSVYRLCVLADGPLGHASLIERTGDTTGATVWFSAAAQTYNSPAGITIGQHTFDWQCWHTDDGSTSIPQLSSSKSYYFGWYSPNNNTHALSPETAAGPMTISLGIRDGTSTTSGAQQTSGVVLSSLSGSATWTVPIKFTYANPLELVMDLNGMGVACGQSSEFDSNYGCEKAFLDNSWDWATAGEGVNSWIDFTAPQPIPYVRHVLYRNRRGGAATHTERNKDFSVAFTLSDGTVATRTYTIPNDESLNTWPAGYANVVHVKITVTGVYTTGNNGADYVALVGNPYAAVWDMPWPVVADGSYSNTTVRLVKPYTIDFTFGLHPHAATGWGSLFYISNSPDAAPLDRTAAAYIYNHGNDRFTAHMVARTQTNGNAYCDPPVNLTSWTLYTGSVSTTDSLTTMTVNGVSCSYANPNAWDYNSVKFYHGSPAFPGAHGLNRFRITHRSIMPTGGSSSLADNEQQQEQQTQQSVKVGNNNNIATGTTHDNNKTQRGGGMVVGMVGGLMFVAVAVVVVVVVVVKRRRVEPTTSPTKEEAVEAPENEPRPSTEMMMA